MADAAPVRARIGALRTAGLTVAEIAGLCGVHPKVVEFAQLGRNGRLPLKVKASLARALEAISYRDAAAVEVPPMRQVDGDLPRRQVQSLHALGWSGRLIAAAAGTAPSNISSLLTGHGTTEKVRAAVASAYEDLRLAAPPETTPSERSQAARARNRAAASGWTPDTAEDHEYARAA
jgi:IS30 family transposase